MKKRYKYSGKIHIELVSFAIQKLPVESNRMNLSLFYLLTVVFMLTLARSIGSETLKGNDIVLISLFTNVQYI